MPIKYIINDSDEISENNKQNTESNGKNQDRSIIFEFNSVAGQENLS